MFLRDLPGSRTGNSGPGMLHGMPVDVRQHKASGLDAAGSYTSCPDYEQVQDRGSQELSRPGGKIIRVIEMKKFGDVFRITHHRQKDRLSLLHR